MSSLTKVLAVMVCVLAIFVCGVVVTFVTSSENWKEAYVQQKTLTEAAQVQAVATEEDAGRRLELSSMLIQRLNDNITALEARLTDLTRQRYAEAQFRGDAEKKADSAVELAKALQLSNESFRGALSVLQADVDELRQNTISAQAQVINLERTVNGLQVEKDRLDTIRRQSDEKIYTLENENAMIRQELEKVTVASSEFRPADDQVSLAPRATGVPIRGQIMQIVEDRAAISVGSSSGVRKGMKLWVTRGDKYLGNLEVSYVETTEAVGHLTNKLAAIVAGDTVTTGIE